MQLEQERRLNKELRSEKVNYANQKNELEDVFVKCLDEVRKQVQKRKDFQIVNQKFQSKTD
jgi:hypothetical protein